MPITRQREIEIEQELARIEREIAHSRKRSLRWKVVKRPPRTPPRLLPGDRNEH